MPPAAKSPSVGRSSPVAAGDDGRGAGSAEDGKHSAQPSSCAQEPDATFSIQVGMMPQSAHPQPSPPPPAAPAAQPGVGSSDAAFDQWLRRELSRLYDEALIEPVPDELLRLLGGEGGKAD